MHQPTRTVYTVQTDHLGSPFQVRTLAGQVVWRWESEAFGKTAPNEDVDGDGNKLTLNLRFPGQYFDRESGLHYNWNRYYSPRLARYMSPDPIGLSGGINLFAYVYGNPLSYVDPFGLDVRICHYPGGVGHVGFGVGDEASTFGFYPERKSPWYKGEVREDPKDESKECKIIPSKPDQDQCMLNCRLRRVQNPGWYRIADRQCTSFVRDCMRECGIPTGISPVGDPWQGPYPGKFFQTLPGISVPSQ